LSLHDSDLISIQEARAGVERASAAQAQFSKFSQAQVDAVVDACALAATDAGEALARTAAEETGYGNVADKTTKNRLASVDVHRAIRGLKTVGIVSEDRERGVLEVAEPFGVVAAVIPVTNPTSTAIYKTLISLKARNAIVLSPHPNAMRCICEAAAVLERASLQAGAPEGLIVCLRHPTMQGTQELMRHHKTGVILATGGTGLVRQAYSSGKPAYGVGPGNVPALIQRTADVRKAVADIFAGKTFDYGTICSSEQAIVAEEAVAARVLEECRAQGGYFLNADEMRRVSELVIRPGSTAPNPKIVGHHATVIAEMAGVKVPGSTRVLIARLEGVGREVPLSAEKLSPILAFYVAANLAAGIDLCVRLLRFGGAGHTASIHSANEAAVREYGLKVPASRVVVNSSAVHGSIGYSTNLFPAMTLGCGSFGGNITSDNIGPQHLMNLKRIAWESRGVEHRTVPAADRLAGVSGVGIGAAVGSGTNATSGATLSASSRRPQDPPSHSEGGAPTTAGSAGGASSRGAGAGAVSARNLPSADAVRAAVASAVAEATTAAAVNPGATDRAAISRIVERAFLSRGIARGGDGVAAAATIEASTAATRRVAGGAGDSASRGEAARRETAVKAEPLSPAALAAKIVAERLGAAHGGKLESSPRWSASGAAAAESSSSGQRRPQDPPSKNEGGAPTSASPTTETAAPTSPTKDMTAAAPALKIAEFVAENDVRMAITRQEKIYIGPKTIVTPSARELGDTHEVLVMTTTNPTPAVRRP
jgi:acetaldehyde dehydrogenase (acetylating)